MGAGVGAGITGTGVGTGDGGIAAKWSIEVGIQQTHKSDNFGPGLGDWEAEF